jgi:hypothetical protein
VAAAGPAQALPGGGRINNLLATRWPSARQGAESLMLVSGDGYLVPQGEGSIDVSLSSLCHHEPAKQPDMGRYEPVPDEA